MLGAALVATVVDSIRDLFLLFMAFLGGVGPVYVLRWFWWRVRASTEISAMVASMIVSTSVTLIDDWRRGAELAGIWPDTLLSPDGFLQQEARLLLVS